MMTAVNLESLVRLSAEGILNCAAEGMVIALLAWMVLRAVGPQNSGTRFAVWFAALLGIAALPLFHLWGGNWASGGAELAKRSEITMPGSWALYIFAGWSLIAAAGLFRVCVGFWHLHRLRKTCSPVEVSVLDALLQRTLADFDSARSVRLCVSHHLRVPTAIGFTKPMVVIPSWTMQELSPSELNAILLHELAHLRRRDDWTNLVQKVLGALLFFHPAVWWIEKKLALEREMACDDAVLAQTTSPRAYAECLVSLAEKSFLRRGLALAQAAVDRLRHVSLRVSQILDVNRPSATRVWRPAPVVVTGMSVLCLVALSHTPTRLVSFGSDGASATPTVSAANAIAASDEMGQVSRMRAHVVPAKLVIRTQEGVPSTKSPVSVAKSGGKRPDQNTPKPGVVPASLSLAAPKSFVQSRAKAPTLVRASIAKDAAAPQTLFFITRTEIVQTRHYDVSGAVVWDLCVWQVTVVGPVQTKMEAGAAAKSI